MVARNHSKLSAIAQVFTIQSNYGLSEAGYDRIIEWVRSIVPKENSLKDNFYSAKSMTKPLGLGYQKLTCALTSACGYSHYKPKTVMGRTLVAYKKLRYFSITPRL